MQIFKHTMFKDACTKKVHRWNSLRSKGDLKVKFFALILFYIIYIFWTWVHMYTVSQRFHRIYPSSYNSEHISFALSPEQNICCSGIHHLRVRLRWGKGFLRTKWKQMSHLTQTTPTAMAHVILGPPPHGKRAGRSTAISLRHFPNLDQALLDIEMH